MGFISFSGQTSQNGSETRERLRNYYAKENWRNENTILNDVPVVLAERYAICRCL